MDFLKEVLGVPQVALHQTKRENGAFIFCGAINETISRCPWCGGTHVLKNGTRTRCFKTVPIGSTPVYVEVTVQRYRCSKCGFDHQEPIGFARGSRHHTTAFERYALELLKFGTIKDVAYHLGVSWDVIKGIHKEFLSRNYGTPDLSGVTCIGIDEFAVRKGHVYKTIVVDIMTGIILWVGDGKGESAVTGFWERAKKQNANIKVVSSDLSSAYISSVFNNAPDAIHVFDHFHVVKLMNEAVDKVRRAACREETDLNKRKVIKGTRWLLLRNGSDPMDKDFKTRLDNALAMNKPLASAYYLKESLRLIWQQKDKAAAEAALDDWIQQASDSGIKPLKKMAATLMARRSGILAWYDCQISNGKVEGINNKIKVMKRDAYGFRDDQYFNLRLYALHDARVTLKVG